jgi:NAD(P)-dependent dehydrogenase (short-subunit alcohol dehydrogenase family)/malonyl CoA-acyl carrier protein transacylase
LITQLTRPVNFLGQIETLLAANINTFVECGPRGVLASLTRQIVNEARRGGDIDVMSTDDGERPGPWAVARVLAMVKRRDLDSLRSEIPESDTPASPYTPTESFIVLDDESSAHIRQSDGFEEFWESTKPAVAQLVHNLWESYQTQRPQVSRESDDTAIEGFVETQTPFPLNDERPGREEIQAFLLEALCEETGYPPDIIEVDADLEADLGIDTVKQAQVLGKVRDRYQLKADQGLSLSDFPTLGHIVDFVLQSINDRPAPSATQVAVPMVDITKRRSQTPLRSEKEIPIPLKRMETKTVRRESKFDEVQVLELSGTAYEIGRAHGEAMRAEIKDIIARYEDFLGEKGLSMVALPEATRTLPKLFDASSLEEIRGIAEGVGLPLAYLVAYNLDTALFPAFTTGCTQAIRTAEANQGTLLHLTNEDSPLRLHLGGRHPRVIQIRRRSDGPHPARTTVHFSLAGQLCGPNAVNDAGLTVTACTLLDRAPPIGLPAGIPHPQLVKRIVEEASTLQEAMQIAKRSRRSGRWGMLISDADRDEAAYLEYDGDQVLLEGRVPGTWVSANHAISGPAPKQTPPEHSIHRAEQAAHLIRGVEALNLEKAKRILRDQYDRARKREVEHATMNTVCRVDNVMSLIVEGKARRLHVTRNVGTGPNLGAFEFMTIDYSPGDQVDSLENINESGRGLVACDEVMHRHLIRVMPEPQSGDIERGFFPSLVLLVGEGPRIEAIGDSLRDRSASVHIAANFEAAHPLFDSLGGARKIDAIGIVLSAAKERKAWNLSDEDWQTRRSAAITGPFKLLKRFLPFRDDAKIFAVTVLGGALGFDNIVQGSPENGGLLGLFKAIRREFDSAQVQVLDTSPSAGAAQVAKALLQELDGGSKRLEVGLLRKSRIRLTMAPRAIRDSAKELDALPASWIITGGARGVTASIAKRLSKLYQPQLFLVGRHVLPESTEVLRLIELSPQKLSAHKDAILTGMKSAPDFTPLLWTQACEEIDKTVEIARNIEEMKSSGSRVHYFSVDVGDREAFAKVITAIRDRGKIEAIIHGAGYELAKTFENKTDDILKKTMSKADGLVNLLALCAQDSLSHFALFSSVVGRFGGHGQTDYAMANEVSARILGTFRAGRPEVKTCCFTWPAWSEVGMAARSSSRVFLENTGQKFMPPEEGANHFIRELWDGFSELEVVICDELGALDLDGLLPRQSDLRRWRQINEQTRGKPLISSVVHYESDQHLIVEREISASEPFLDQHRMGAVPILPAVAGLEMMLEMLSLTPGNWTLADVKIEHPLKVKEGNRASVRVILEDDALRVVASARRPDGVMLEPERVHLRARRVEQQAMQKRERPSWSGPASPFPYPRQIDRTPGSRLMYHGPVFRCLQGVLPNEHGGTAKLVIPPPEALVENSLRDRWVLNSALLDGCLQAAGLLGRMKYALSALPVGFGRIDFSQRCTVSVGETVYLDVHIRRTSEEELESDLYLFGENGLLLSVKSYRSLVVRGVR